MSGFVGSGYDVLMMLWGAIFIVGAVAFLLGMNRLFQSEERLQGESLDAGSSTSHADSHPFHPAA